MSFGARIVEKIRTLIGKKTPRKPVRLDIPGLKRIIRGIVTTSVDEIDCDECFRQLDRFAELYLAGKDPGRALPLVQQHLETCNDCREEFEALLRALEAEQPEG